MTNYTCEDRSLCENFQAAICLHCNHRLCVQHIIEHDKIVFNQVQIHSNLVEITFQQIKDKLEKSNIIYNDLLSTLDQYRKQQLEKIEQIYENESKLIILQEEHLKTAHEELLVQLERGARQPLERVQKQQNANIEILNHIRQIIDNVRKDHGNLKWNFQTPSSNNIGDFPPIPVAISKPMIDNIKLIENHSSSSSSERSLSVRSSISSINNVVKLRKGRGLKRLVQMFSDLSSITERKHEIDIYIKHQNKFFKLPILVSSYLTAWYQNSKTLANTSVLNVHISTIKKYLINRNSDFDVLTGIQAFFFNQTSKKNQSEIMTYLLKFFLKHQCINEILILNWYYNNIENGYMGFYQAKLLAEPFIKSLNQ